MGEIRRCTCTKRPHVLDNIALPDPYAVMIPEQGADAKAFGYKVEHLWVERGVKSTRDCKSLIHCSEAKSSATSRAGIYHVLSSRYTGNKMFERSKTDEGKLSALAPSVGDEIAQAEKQTDSEEDRCEPREVLFAIATDIAAEEGQPSWEHQAKLLVYEDRPAAEGEADLSDMATSVLMASSDAGAHHEQQPDAEWENDESPDALVDEEGEEADAVVDEEGEEANALVDEEEEEAILPIIVINKIVVQANVLGEVATRRHSSEMNRPSRWTFGVWVGVCLGMIAACAALIAVVVYGPGETPVVHSLWYLPIFRRPH